MTGEKKRLRKIVLYEIQIVKNSDHKAPFLHPQLQEFDKVTYCLRINTCKRLIQKNHRRIL